MVRKTVFIVDDDPCFQSLLRRRLESSGFDCISAVTVEAALQRVKLKVPDLVLLDLGFHKIDGTAFLQHLREWVPPHEKVPPVIVVSGYSDREIVDFMLDNGAVDFIAKPFETSELISMVRNYI